MTIPLPQDVQFILNRLTENGYEAYAVGGCIRDSLMRVTPKDWDIASSALPTQVKQLFSHTFDTGIKHGTVTVLLHKERYEVTTFRVDGAYFDSRRPSSVTFSRHIQDDLSRRDFTMNAIAYHPSAGFADPFNGQEDISRGVIRCVGEAERRFGEDALRMLRAVRFAGQLGFTIEGNTMAAIGRLAPNLRNISAERIREELTKTLLSPNPMAAMLLRETDLLRYALFTCSYRGNFSENLRMIESCPKQTAMRYALFLSWAGDECGTLMRELRFDNKTIQETSAYVAWLPVHINNDRYQIKKVLNQLRPEWLRNLITLKKIKASSTMETGHWNSILNTLEDILSKGEIFSLDQLAVNGGDLVSAGIKQGKPVGGALMFLLDLVMRNPLLNQKEILLAHLPID